MYNEVIKIEDLTIGYGERHVLSNINATIRAGEVVGIIGCNGAGKSTLLKTIRGLLQKHSGEVFYFGKRLEDYAEKELACKVAYLQQHVEVGFGYTGKDIVLTGRYPHMEFWQGENAKDEELALACMDYTGTLDLADKPVTEVSGGQKQRILLAKVLAQQTPILFLDEPTTGLDMVYQEEIFRFADSIAKMGKAVLMVVHELNLAAKYCTRILLLGEGKLLADAPPHLAFTDELLSRAYKAEIKVHHNLANNNLEISTKANPKRIAAENELLAKICGVEVV